MPDTNGFIHVGIGYNRVADSVYSGDDQVHFNSVSINGSIVYNLRLDKDSATNTYLVTNGSIRIEVVNPVYIKSWNVLRSTTENPLYAIYMYGDNSSSQNKELDTIFYSNLSIHQKTFYVF